jgi:hypothetical protein
MNGAATDGRVIPGTRPRTWAGHDVWAGDSSTNDPRPAINSLSRSHAA